MSTPNTNAKPRCSYCGAPCTIHYCSGCGKRRPRIQGEDETTICAFSGKPIENGDGWSVADERAYQEAERRIEEQR